MVKKLNELSLSKRLALVAEQIPNGSTIADIGSDHAYLPCYAYLKGIISGGVAGEVNEGPYQSAIAQVRKSGLEEKISVRKGNGLGVIRADEVGVITICGMGGSLIATILEEGKEKLDGVNRLILQPNVAADQVRIWLKDNQWELLTEEILEEDEKIYEILVAEQGNALKPYTDNLSMELLLGPFLMQKKSIPFQKKWISEITIWKNVLNQLEKAQQTEEILARKEALKAKIAQVEEVIK